MAWLTASCQLYYALVLPGLSLLPTSAHFVGHTYFLFKELGHRSEDAWHVTWYLDFYWSIDSSDLFWAQIIIRSRSNKHGESTKIQRKNCSSGAKNGGRNGCLWGDIKGCLFHDPGKRWKFSERSGYRITRERVVHIIHPFCAVGPPGDQKILSLTLLSFVTASCRLLWLL